MTDVVGSVIKHIKVKENNLDNGVFMVFSKGSMVLCLLGAAIVMANQVEKDEHLIHT